MKYAKNISVGGAWVDKTVLHNGQGAKIVSETNPEPSKFVDEKTGEFKMQNVCKVRFNGVTDAVKVALNRTTLNALIDAYGEESRDWQAQTLTVDMRKQDGKTYLYLIPNGYKRTEDTEGYTIIVPQE